MRYWPLSINFYLYNLMADERQRGSHEIVQSPDKCAEYIDEHILDASIIDLKRRLNVH